MCFCGKSTLIILGKSEDNEFPNCVIFFTILYPYIILRILSLDTTSNSEGLLHAGVSLNTESCVNFKQERYKQMNENALTLRRQPVFQNLFIYLRTSMKTEFVSIINLSSSVASSWLGK